VGNMTNFLFTLALAGFFVGAFGVINVLVPMRSLGIGNRRKGFLIAVLAFATGFGFSRLWHNSLPAEEQAKIDARAGARQEKRVEQKVYSTGTLLAMAEGKAGWVGVGASSGSITAGLALPTHETFAYAVKVGDTVYIGRCTSLLHLKKTLRDIPSTMQARIDGTHLYIVSQNGKEIRLKVVERIPSVP
jgi:hypothetical protein